MMNITQLLKRVETVGDKEAPSAVQRIQDLEKINNYKPTPKQLLAHLAKEIYKLFGGSMGGGKSVWLVCSAIFHCLRYAGARVFLCRQHLSSFKKTTLLTLLEFLPYPFVRKHNKTECFIQFKNKSRLYYGGLGDDVKSIEKLKSMELSAWGCDQVEEISEQFFHMLNSRLRLKIPGVRIKYETWLTCNPTSNWPRQRFIENKFDDHIFIPSLPAENPHLESNYVERLRETLPEELLKAWVEGDWSIISDENNIFTYEEINAAINRKASKKGEAYYSVDVARYGGDESIIAKWQGNCVSFEDTFSKKSTMETAGRVIKATGNSYSALIKIDSIGVGAGVYDRLSELKYNVQEYIGSGSAKENRIYKNKRAEDYFRLKKILPELSIPNDPKLRAQMMAIRYRIFSDGLILIESKDEMRKRGLPSPDRLDALVMVCSGDKFLTTKEIKQKLETSKPVKGEHKWPARRAKSKKQQLEEEMRQYLGGNITVKKSKPQTFSLEDMGIESDIKPSRLNPDSD